MAISLWSLNQQVVNLAQAVLQGGNEGSGVIGGSVGGTVSTVGGISNARPTATENEVIQYDSETVAMDRHTIIDPVVVTRRTQQIQDVGAMSAAQSEQQRLALRLTAQSQAPGLQIGNAYTGRNTTRFQSMGNMRFTRDANDFRILDMEVTPSGNTYVLVSDIIDGGLRGQIFNLDGTISTSTASRIYDGAYNVNLLRFNPSGILQYCVIVASYSQPGFPYNGRLFSRSIGKCMSVDETNDRVYIVLSIQLVAGGVNHVENISYSAANQSHRTDVPVVFSVARQASNGNYLIYSPGTSFSSSSSFLQQYNDFCVVPVATNETIIMYQGTCQTSVIGTNTTGTSSNFPSAYSHSYSSHPRSTPWTTSDLIQFHGNRASPTTGLDSVLYYFYSTAAVTRWVALSNTAASPAVIIYGSTFGGTGVLSQLVRASRTKRRVMLIRGVTWANDAPGTSPTNHCELVLTAGDSNLANDPHIDLGGAVQTRAAGAIRTNQNGNHYVFAYVNLTDINKASFLYTDNYSLKGSDGTTNYTLASNGCVAISLTGGGLITHVSPMISIPAQIRQATLCRDSTRVMVHCEILRELFEEAYPASLTNTVKIYRLNILPNATLTAASIAAEIPFPQSSFLMLIYDVSTGDLVRYFTCNTQNVYEYANDTIMAWENIQYIGTETTFNYPGITAPFRKGYDLVPVDQFANGTSYRSINMASAFTTVERSSGCTTFLNGVNGAITCTYTANNYLIVAGWLQANQSARVPNLNGTPSSYYIMQTAQNRNAVRNPFIIVYSMEEGEVITAGRMMDVDGDTITNVEPAAVVFDVATQSVFIALSTDATTNVSAQRYVGIQNNRDNNSIWMFIGQSRTVQFNMPANGAFIFKCRLVGSSTLHMVVANQGVHCWMINSRITSLMLSPYADDRPWSQLTIVGWTTEQFYQATSIPQDNVHSFMAQMTYQTQNSFNGRRSAFAIHLRTDISQSNATNGTIGVPQPNLLGGSGNIQNTMPLRLNISSNREMVLVGTVTPGTYRMFSNVSDLFPFVNDSSNTSFWTGLATTNLSSLFDYNTSAWSAASTGTYFDSNGNFTSTANQFGGVWIQYNCALAMDVPMWVSGVRATAASATALNRPRRVRVNYQTVSGGTWLQAYDSSADEVANYIDNVLYISFPPVRCHTIVFSIVASYSANVTLLDLKFHGVSKWYPHNRREIIDASIWETSTSSSGAGFGGGSSTENPFRYSETSAWSTSSRYFLPNINPYNSSGIYTGTDTRGGEWLRFNITRHYGRPRKVSGVRIIASSTTTTDRALRVRLFGWRTGASSETMIYNSATDETYTNHVSGNGYGVCEITSGITDVGPWDYIVFVITRTANNDNAFVYGLKFFDPDFEARSLSFTTLTDTGFVAKWDSDGTPRFFGPPITTLLGTSSATSVDFDPIDNSVYVCGHFTGDSSSINNLATGASAITVSNAGSTDIYLAKYTPSGTLIQGRRVLGGANAENNAIVNVGSTQNVFVAGQFSSTTATPYSLSDGVTPVGISNLAATGASDVFMLTFNNSGMLTFATNVLSTTGTETLVGFEKDVHEGYVLTGSTTATMTARNYFGDIVPIRNNAAGAFVMRVHGGQRANDVRLLPFYASASIRWCDMKYVDMGSEKAMFVLMFTENAVATAIPRLDGTPSTQTFTRVLSSARGGPTKGLYLIKYDGVTGDVLWGDLVTSTRIFTTSETSVLHSTPRMAVTPQGDVFVAAIAQSNNYNASFTHFAYSVNGGSGKIALPAETSENPLYRLFMAKYNKDGVIQMANYTVSPNANNRNALIHTPVLASDTSGNVVVTFTSNAYNNGTAFMIQMNHLNQARVGGTVFGSPQHNLTSQPNYCAYAMMINANGEIVWGRLLVNDLYPSNTLYTTIQAVECIGDNTYFMGQSTGYGDYRVFNDNMTPAGVIQTDSPGALERTVIWVVKVATINSSVVRASRVLIGSYQSTSQGYSIRQLWCSWTSQNRTRLWMGMNYLSVSNNTLMYNLDTGATHPTFHNNPSWSQSTSCVMCINTGTDQIDMWTRRGTVNSNSSTFFNRISAGCVDSSGNIYVLQHAYAGFGSFQHHFNGSIAKRPGIQSIGYGQNDGAPLTSVVLKYDPSGMYTSHIAVNLSTTDVNASACMEMIGSEDLYIAMARNIGLMAGTSNGHNLQVSVADKNNNLIAANHRNISPIIKWTQNFDALSAAANPTFGLQSYNTWVADTLPTVTSSVGLNTESYAFGNYSSSAILSLNHMFGNVSSGRSLPSTSGVSSIFFAKMNANKECETAARIASNATFAEAIRPRLLTSTVIVAVIAAGNLSVFNMDGSPATGFGTNGVLSTASGNVVLLRYSLSTWQCLRADILITGTVSNCRTFAYDSFYDAFVLSGNMGGPGVVQNYNGIVKQRALTAGGFVIKMSIAGDIQYGGTLLPMGTLTGVAVNSMGRVAVVGVAGSSIASINPSGTTFTMSSAGLNAMVRIDASGNTENGGFQVDVGTMVAVGFDGEDNMDVVISHAANAMVTPLGDSTGSAGLAAVQQSSSIITINRKLALTSGRVVSVGSTPRSMVVDVLGNIYLVGTFTGTINMSNLSNGITSDTTYTSVGSDNFFMITILTNGVASQLSHLTTMPTTFTDFSVETTSNTMYLSYNASGNGNVRDRNTSNVYTISNGLARTLWVHEPLNINVSGVSSTINVSLPNLGLSKLLVNKRILLPTGFFRIIRQNVSGTKEDYVSIPTATIGSLFYDWLMGEWKVQQNV